MQNVILSTAAFCLWDIEAPEKLKIGQNLAFNSIQIALSTIKMVEKFAETLEEGLDLSSFSSISLHAPWCGVKYGENSKTNKLMALFENISRKIKIDCLIFRVDCIDDIHFLNQSTLPVCLENSDKIGCWDKLQYYLINKDFKLALNVNRATRRENYIDELINQYGGRVERILVSGYTKGKGRTPLLETNQMSLLNKIKNIEAPLVLEGLFKPGDYISIVHEREEIATYLKKLKA